MCLPATVMLITNSMLLWWTSDSGPLPLVIKPKVVKETLQWSGERKCKVTSIKPNCKANWTCNAIASLLLNDPLVRRRTDLEKTVNMNWLLISLSVTTIADAFLRKGNVCVHDQLSALCRNTRKKQTSQESNPCIPQSSPKAQVYATGVPNLSLIMYPLLNFLQSF